MTPRLTLNAGVRWDIQMPFQAVNDVMSRATFADACGVSGHRAGWRNAGSSSRARPAASTRSSSSTRMAMRAGRPTGTTSRPTSASRGCRTWRPASCARCWAIRSRRRCGPVTRSTTRVKAWPASRAYSVPIRAARSTSTRNANSGLLIPPGESYPVLFREKDRLGPPSSGQVPAVSCDASGACVPAYPILARANRQDGMNLFHPDIQVAFARSYTLSFQRALSRDMAVDIRYVGTRGVNQWTDENYNEINIIENGFYDEFKPAMGNLQANQAAGRGNTFAFTGVPGHGTAADVPRVPQRIAGRQQSGGLLRQQLDERHVRRPVGADAAAAVRRRGGSRRQRRAARPTRRSAGYPGEPLRPEP